MPQPKRASFPAIRASLKFYQIASIITGVMLLLLCTEMIVKYGFGYELFAGGSGGFLWFSHVNEFGGSTGDGMNLSMAVLIGHGWFYVVYLFSIFRMWSLMRWSFPRFILLALCGVVPLLSFFMEVWVSHNVRGYLARREAAAPQPTPAPEGAR